MHPHYLYRLDTGRRHPHPIVVNIALVRIEAAWTVVHGVRHAITIGVRQRSACDHLNLEMHRSRIGITMDQEYLAPRSVDRQPPWLNVIIVAGKRRGW